MRLQCAEQSVDLSTPKIMGILNITPDSFSDGGELWCQGKPQLELIYQRAEAMLVAGASILDVGGESTRPGAIEISAQEEMDRVLPVVEMLSPLPVVISVDTSKPQLMREAIALGATMINDVRALTMPGAIAELAASQAAVCLMHMQGQPQTMQHNPDYTDVVHEVSCFLAQRIELCEKAGIARSRLMIDPGFGFGKTFAHNLSLLKKLKVLQNLQLPVLVGLSKKSVVGDIVSAVKEQRLVGSLAAGLMALMQGAHILRVHDVQQTQDVIKVFNAVSAAK